MLSNFLKWRSNFGKTVFGNKLWASNCILYIHGYAKYETGILWSQISKVPQFDWSRLEVFPNNWLWPSLHPWDKVDLSSRNALIYTHSDFSYTLLICTPLPALLYSIKFRWYRTTHYSVPNTCIIGICMEGVTVGLKWMKCMNIEFNKRNCAHCTSYLSVPLSSVQQFVCGG